MSETATESTSTQDGTDTQADTRPAATDEFKPITSQDDLNRILNERLQRERAKYADYRDVKAKAAKLDEIEEKNKTEAQRLADRIAVAEKAAAEARSDVLRYQIAAEFQLTPRQSDALAHVSSEDGMRLLAEEFQQARADQTARDADRKKQGNHVPREGATSSTAESDESTTVRELFGG